jgi:hypothetical protein
MTIHPGSLIALLNAIEVAASHSDLALADDLRSLERKVRCMDADQWDHVVAAVSGQIVGHGLCWPNELGS